MSQSHVTNCGESHGMNSCMSHITESCHQLWQGMPKVISHTRMRDSVASVYIHVMSPSHSTEACRKLICVISCHITQFLQSKMSANTFDWWGETPLCYAMGPPYILYYSTSRSYTCVAWLFDMCDVKHSHVWRDPFTCVTWHIHACDMAYQLVDTPSPMVYVCDKIYMCNIYRAICVQQRTYV